MLLLAPFGRSAAIISPALWFICDGENCFLKGGNIEIYFFGIVIPFPSNLAIPRLPSD